MRMIILSVCDDAERLKIASFRTLGKVKVCWNDEAL